MPQLLIYIPLVMIFVLDFLVFGGHPHAQDEPEMWLKRKPQYNIELAARREDFGYGGG